MKNETDLDKMLSGLLEQAPLRITLEFNRDNMLEEGTKVFKALRELGLQVDESRTITGIGSGRVRIAMQLFKQ